MAMENMFVRPNELTITLAELDGLPVAFRWLADGNVVRRTMSDGTTVEQTPILVDVLVYEKGAARKETTLIFPDSIKDTVNQAGRGSFVFGKVSKDVHPKNDEWTLWALHTLSDKEEVKVLAAFGSLINA